jgi:hypothetical protein
MEKQLTVKEATEALDIAISGLNANRQTHMALLKCLNLVSEKASEADALRQRVADLELNIKAIDDKKPEKID